MTYKLDYMDWKERDNCGRRKTLAEYKERKGEEGEQSENPHPLYQIFLYVDNKIRTQNRGGSNQILESTDMSRQNLGV